MRISVERSSSPPRMTSRMLVTYIANTTVPAYAGKNVAATIT